MHSHLLFAIIYICINKKTFTYLLYCVINEIINILKVDERPRRFIRSMRRLQLVSPSRNTFRYRIVFGSHKIATQIRRVVLFACYLELVGIYIYVQSGYSLGISRSSSKEKFFLNSFRSTRISLVCGILLVKTLYIGNKLLGVMK